MSELELVPTAAEVPQSVKRVRVRSKRRKAGATLNLPSAVNRILIGLVQDGQWIDAGELRDKALEAIKQIASSGAGKDGGSELALDGGEIEYLDAGVLQVLLAVRRECQTYGAVLSLLHVSPALEQWFGYAGAEDLLESAAERTE